MLALQNRGLIAENPYCATARRPLYCLSGKRSTHGLRRKPTPRIKVDRMRQQLARQKNAIIAEVSTSFEKLAQGKAQIEDAKKAIEHARAAYESASKSAEMGMYSLYDLLTAELRLTRAELNLTDAYAMTRKAQSELLYSIGG